MKKLLIVLVVLAFVGTVQAEMMTANRGWEAGTTADWLQWASGSGPGGWQSWNDTYTVINDGTAYEGTYYARLGQSGCENWGWNGTWQGEATTIPAVGGLTLDLSAEFRTTTAIQSLLKIEAFGAAGYISGLEVLTPLTADGAWYLHTMSYLLPEGTTNVRAMVGSKDNGAAWTIDVDDASLTPEPATLALLGLGGLFLRRRK